MPSEAFGAGCYRGKTVLKGPSRGRSQHSPAINGHRMVNAMVL